MYLIFYCSISILLCLESCRTPENEPGTCVSIQECKRIFDLINQVPKPFSPFLNSFLQKRFCGLSGNEHYICCSNDQISRPKTAGSSPWMEDVSNHPNLYLLPISCGIISNNRVANGENTTIDELPFMALLRVRHEAFAESKFACAGTIINKRYILTAAHCVTAPAVKLISVRVGEHVISTEKDCIKLANKEYCNPQVEDIEVEEFVANPRYYSQSFEHDIAVIRLKKDINLNNSNMNPICLPINNNIPLDIVLTAGWGLTEAKTTSDILLKAKLPIVDLASCKKIYVGSTILESHICAGGKNRTQTCIGDSGGPIFKTWEIHNHIRYVQFGVVTAGPNVCGGDTNIPGLYTRIHHYMKWILDQLKP